MPSLVRLKKDSAITSIFQLSEEGKRTLFEQNNQLVEFLKSKLNDPSVEEQTKQSIRNSVSQSGDDLKRMEEESIRYLLWLDSTRCSAFFAEIVLVCEGSTEKTFIEYLIENEWNDLTNRRVCIMDAMGKYNVHRCMNLLKELGIAHSVLLDRDEDIRIQPFLNEFIQSQKNDLTKGIYFFEKDIETFLGVPPPERPDRKPLNVMWHYVKGKIPNGKMEELHTIVRDLLP